MGMLIGRVAVVVNSENDETEKLCDELLCTTGQFEIRLKEVSRVMSLRIKFESDDLLYCDEKGPLRRQTHTHSHTHENDLANPLRQRRFLRPAAISGEPSRPTAR